MIDLMQRLAALDAQNPNMVQESTPGYIKYEQMKDKIASVLIKLYDQGKDLETIKQMGARIATYLGYDPADRIFQDAFLSSFTDASLDGAFDNPDEDDQTDYSMRQGEMGNPDRRQERNMYETKESQMENLNLASLRMLSGIKAKIAECGIPAIGGMSGQSSIPASITASAGSGRELSDMLKDIMSLAGVKPVTQNDMPIEPTSTSSPVPRPGEPDMKALMAVVDEPDQELDGMNDIGHDMDSEDDPEDEGIIGGGLGGMAGGAAGELGGAALGGLVGGPIGAAIGGFAGDVAGTALGSKAGDKMTGEDSEEITDEEWTMDNDVAMTDKIHINHDKNRPYDNSPKEKIRQDGVRQFGDANSGGGGDRMDGNMPKAKVSDAMAESLFADYQKFVAEAVGTSPDRLLARTGLNSVNKVPRKGQTDLRNIPAGNRPDSKNKFSDSDKSRQPSDLKAAIKGQLGKHKAPALPEAGEHRQNYKPDPAKKPGIGSKIAGVAKKVFDKVAPGDDELLTRLEKSSGGKRPNKYNAEGLGDDVLAMAKGMKNKDGSPRFPNAKLRTGPQERKPASDKPYVAPKYSGDNSMSSPAAYYASKKSGGYTGD